MPCPLQPIIGQLPGYNDVVLTANNEQGLKSLMVLEKILIDEKDQ